jgi:hypothetical protein
MEKPLQGGRGAHGQMHKPSEQEQTQEGANGEKQRH